MSKIIVCGSPSPLPLRGFPEGKTRIRIRPNSATMVYVRPPEGGIRSFFVEEYDGFWNASFEDGRNVQL